MLKTRKVHDHAEEYERLCEDLEDITSKLLETKAAISVAADDIKTGAKDILLEQAINIKNRASDAEQQFEGIIKKKPIKSIGIALLVGTVIGYFLHK